MITFRVDNIKNMNACLKPFLEYLKGLGVDENAVFESRLVSCELISNVIRHLGETACFEGTLSDDGIVITVSSENTDGSKLCATLPDVFAESGRGLYIIKAICSKISSEGCSVKVCRENKKSE